MCDVSVIVPSYNHGQYVLAAVDSVLRQSAPVKEVIIVDDGSGDDSLAKLRSIRDGRVRIIAHARNEGGSRALNTGIQAAQSPLIAICNSDDIWEPHKLQVQLRVLDRHPQIAAVFSDVTLIDRSGHAIEGDTPFTAIFRRKNRSRHAWLKALVEGGNCLCHPSVLIRRAVYDRIGLYDNRLRQLPDYKMWLSMTRYFEFRVVEDRLVRFRLHDNTSTPSPAVTTRERNEFADIMDDFFRDLDADSFCRAFGSRFVPDDARFNIGVEKFLYLWSTDNVSGNIFRFIASRILMELLQAGGGEKAWSAYGFTMPEFHILRGMTSPWISLRENVAASPAEKDLLRRLANRSRSLLERAGLAVFKAG